MEMVNPELDPGTKEDEDRSDGREVRKSHHSQRVKNNLTSRLNRIEGQIRGCAV